MSTSPGKEQLEQVAAELAIDPVMVEKDWHVVQALAFISGLYLPGFHIAFTGGTSLSKAHGLIKRFSEDIDFKVVTDDKKPGRSALSNLKNTLIKVLEEAGFRVIHESIAARDANRFFSFHLEYDSLFSPHTGLRPHIQLEFTVSAPALPLVEREVASFFTELKQETPEAKHVACISPVEIAGDKLSALVWRIPVQAVSGKPEDRSLVRHIHDLAALEPIVAGNDDFQRLALEALQNDRDRNKDLASRSTQEKFEILLRTLSTEDKKYREAYDMFVQGLSYAAEGDVPDYHTAVAALQRLTEKVLAS